jgi:hypothetical protein
MIWPLSNVDDAGEFKDAVADKHHHHDEIAAQQLQRRPHARAHLHRSEVVWIALRLGLVVEWVDDERYDLTTHPNTGLTGPGYLQAAMLAVGKR